MVTQDDKMEFPCTACGLCCRLVGQNPITAFLDRGDGICGHLDTDTNLCRIYEDRPLVCRVKDFYQAYLTETLSWEEYVNMNVQVCQRLAKDYIAIKKL